MNHVSIKKKHFLEYLKTKLILISINHISTSHVTKWQAGHFTVTFSAYAQLQPGEGVWLHLAHQGEEVLVVDQDDDDDVA